MYIFKITAAKLYLLIFLQSAYGQQSPSNGILVEIYPNNSAKKLQERCEKFDEGVYWEFFLSMDFTLSI